MLPVGAAVLVGPYVQTVVQPPGDLPRLRVLAPSGRGLLGLAAEMSDGVPPCTVAIGAGLLQVLAPHLGAPPPAMLAAEGFA